MGPKETDLLKRFGYPSAKALGPVSTPVVLYTGPPVRNVRSTTTVELDRWTWTAPPGNHLGTQQEVLFPPKKSNNPGMSFALTAISAALTDKAVRAKRLKNIPIK